MKKRYDTLAPELLFVESSSQDSKGKRVLVRDHGVENWIYPDQGVTNVDIQLLGIEPGQKVEIERFFSQR